MEGTIRQPAGDGAAEYSVVLTIRNERGEEITRQVIGVGALKPDETRTFTLAVEMFAAPGSKGRRRADQPASRHAAASPARVQLGTASRSQPRAPHAPALPLRAAGGAIRRPSARSHGGRPSRSSGNAQATRNLRSEPGNWRRAT